MPKAGAILLAAGRASRFGSDKRQAVGDWGVPLLHHVLGLYRPCFDLLGVVIGPDDSFGAAACALFSTEMLVNDQAYLGMGRSLAVGAAWLAEQKADCAVIGLADMPWIMPATIAAVAAEGLRSAKPVVPVMAGHLGFPRALPARLFSRLMALDGDRGASAVLDWRDARWLECDDPGILLDIDKPEDLMGGKQR